jgi:hypothetical protein
MPSRFKTLPHTPANNARVVDKLSTNLGLVCNIRNPLPIRKENLERKILIEM